MNGIEYISIKISPRFVPKGPIDNIAAFVQIMAWRRPGEKPLSEPMRSHIDEIRWPPFCKLFFSKFVSLDEKFCILSSLTICFHVSIGQLANIGSDDGLG